MKAALQSPSPNAGPLFGSVVPEILSMWSVRFLLLTFFTWLAFSTLPLLALAQISPGDLAKAHEDLEGMNKCMKCHDFGSGPSAEKCLDCHQEIAVRLRTKEGYHYQVVEKEKQTCFGCHSDHAGRDFELVHWPSGMEKFDHPKAGYVLEGAHANVECRKCHAEVHVKNDPRKYNDTVDLERTFLGLGQACLDCHHDEHREQLGGECATCHNMKGWHPAPGFDHAKARYVLTGKHREVRCAKCHPSVADKKGEKDKFAWKDEDARFARYTHLEFGNCTTCHQDPHKGKFGATCEKCHSTRGWKSVALADFDHSKTRFALAGKHTTVECSGCHQGATQLKFDAYEECRDCHSDKHLGQFAHRESAGRCEECHSVQGFLPASFSARDHDMCRFPLSEAHRAQPCVACHTPIEQGELAGARRYRFESLKCAACHADVHGGQFAERNPPKDCEACHRSTYWRDIAFDHVRDTAFPLEGAHLKVPCQGCHRLEKASGYELVRYRPVATSCKSCHAGNPDIVKKG